MRSDAPALIGLSDLDRREFGPLGRRALEAMEGLAKRFNHQQMGYEHLLAGILVAARDGGVLKLEPASTAAVIARIEAGLWEQREQFRSPDATDRRIHIPEDVLACLRQTDDLADGRVKGLLWEYAKLVPTSTGRAVITLLEGKPVAAMEFDAQPVEDTEAELEPEPEPEPPVERGSTPARKVTELLSNALAAARPGDAKPTPLPEDAAEEADPIPDPEPIRRSQPHVPFTQAASTALDTVCHVRLPAWESCHDRMATVLAGRRRRSVVVVGPTGGGQDLLVRQFVKDVLAGRLGTLADTPFYVLDLLQVQESAVSGNGTPLGLGQCLDRLSRMEDAVLVVLNGDLLLQPLVTMPAFSLVRGYLAHQRIRMLVALSDTAYRCAFTDETQPGGSYLAGRVLSVRMPRVDRDAARTVLTALKQDLDPADTVALDDEALDAVVDACPVVGDGSRGLDAGWDLLEELLADADGQDRDTIGTVEVEDYLRRCLPE